MAHHIVVMGVSGCGKSTLGAAIAAELNATFFDADNFHPPANKEKMRTGLALNDDDRAPWLEALNAQLVQRACAGESAVLACSALKARYREVLRRDIPALRFVFLVGTYDELHARMSARKHEYMPASLLQSQLDTLEPPRVALQIPIVWPTKKQMRFAVNSILGDNSEFGV